VHSPVVANKMKNSLITLIVLLFFQFGKSQIIDLSEWKIDSLPLTMKELSEANKSKLHWSFNSLNDTVRIVKNTYTRINGDTLPFPIDSVKNISGTKYIKTVFNGYLVG
jgi:hypothetical protein